MNNSGRGIGPGETHASRSEHTRAEWRILSLESHWSVGVVAIRTSLSPQEVPLGYWLHDIRRVLISLHEMHKITRGTVSRERAKKKRKKKKLPGQLFDFKRLSPSQHR